MKFAGLWAVGVLICCTGCGGGDSATPSNPTQNAIIGRWAADSIQGPGDTPRHCPTSIVIGDATYACGVIDTQVYRVDGSYDELIGGQRGTWTTMGNTLMVMVSGQPARSYTYSIQKDVLTEQLSTGNGPITLTFRRQ